jgi:DNA repair photolyase
MKKEKQVFGTVEWAVKNVNFINGCQHDCKYCYAKEMAIRFKRKTPSTWVNEEVNLSKVEPTIRKVKGYVMFPSTHDITPENVEYSMICLENILASGNDVLIISKPHFSVIQMLCTFFSDCKDRILFRFTIGSTNSETLRFWEPNAPSYEERKKCLIYTHRKGFKTSVSFEPMSDVTVEEIVSEIEPYITDSVWIGKMNHLLKRLNSNGTDDSETIQHATELIKSQSDENICNLYHRLTENPKIKWKESIKKVMGLEVSSQKEVDN